MDYLLTFLEGIVTFISPCLLPMLPIYITYFAGDNNQGDIRKTVKNAIGFVLGFTIVFVTLGAFAGTIGFILREYKTAVNLVSGFIIILFGLNTLEIIRLQFININRQFSVNKINLRFFSALIFGIIFAIGWTPCVGVFLSSALMLAASSASSLQGILLLLCFSIGLGLPFIASAILIDNLKSTFDFIKNNYGIINKISGVLLIVIGILVATGSVGYLLNLFTV